MASPFTVFRRNQKMMLAVVGVLAMIAFVFLGPLMQYSARSADSTNPVVAETVYGPIRESELKNLVQTRELVDRFLQAIAKANVLKYGIDQRFLLDASARMYEQLKQRLTDRFGQRREAAALDTMLLAKKAEQMNVVVTNAAINQYLKKIVESGVGRDLPEIINSLGGPHNEVSQKQLFDALRTELMAAKVIELFESGILVFPPAERWEYYTRLNRRATVEVMPLVVDKFLEQARQPTEKEVQAFFDEYKNRFEVPGSPEPGFKEPPKADFQYFKVDFGKLVAEAEVTDEEIEKYYEFNKDRFFRHRDVPSTDEKPADTAEPGKDESDSEKPAAGAEGDQKPTTDGEKDADKAKPENSVEEKNSHTPEDKPSEPKSDGTQPAGAKPAPAATEGTQGAKPASGNKKKGAEFKRAFPRRAEAKIVLTSGPAQPAPEKVAKKPDPSGDQAAGATKAAVDKESLPPQAKNAAAEKTAAKKSSGEGEKTPSDEGGAADEAAQKKAKSSPSSHKDHAESSDAGAGSEKDAETKEPAKSPEESAEGTDKAGESSPPKYDPLDKVKDTIRETLARERAEQKSRDIALKLSAEMRKAASLAKSPRASQAAKTDESIPDLDFERLAKEEGAIAGRTGLHSAVDLSKTEIGQSYEDFESGTTGSLRRRYFLDFAFGKSKFQPGTTRDDERNRFVFWKDDEAEEKVPQLDQVRLKVVGAWRLGQAREAARKKAEEDTKEARAAQRSLEDTFGKQEGVKVSRLEPFTWMTMGSAPSDPGAGMPRVSEVVGVEDAGQDFMRTVFSLAPGEVGSAMNQSQSAVYVIRLLEYDPSTEQLQKDFVREPFAKYWQVGRHEHDSEVRTWLERLRQEAQYRLLRQLDRREQIE